MLSGCYWTGYDELSPQSQQHCHTKSCCRTCSHVPVQSKESKWRIPCTLPETTQVDPSALYYKRRIGTGFLFLIAIVFTVADRTKWPRRVDTVEAKDDRRRVEYVCICIPPWPEVATSGTLRIFLPLSRWGPWLKSKTSRVLDAVGGLSMYAQQPLLAERACIFASPSSLMLANCRDGYGGAPSIYFCLSKGLGCRFR